MATMPESAVPNLLTASPAVWNAPEVLNAEKAKLQEMKIQLADIRARAKDKSLGQGQRNAAKDLITC